MLKSIKKRDKSDFNRKISPLKKTKDSNDNNNNNNKKIKKYIKVVKGLKNLTNATLKVIRFTKKYEVIPLSFYINKLILNKEDSKVYV